MMEMRRSHFGSSVAFLGLDSEACRPTQQSAEDGSLCVKSPCARSRRGSGYVDSYRFEGILWELFEPTRRRIPDRLQGMALGQDGGRAHGHRSACRGRGLLHR